MSSTTTGIANVCVAGTLVCSCIAVDSLFNAYRIDITKTREKKLIKKTIKYAGISLAMSLVVLGITVR